MQIPDGMHHNEKSRVSPILSFEILKFFAEKIVASGKIWMMNILTAMLRMLMWLRMDRRLKPAAMRRTY